MKQKITRLAGIILSLVMLTATCLPANAVIAEEAPKESTSPVVEVEAESMPEDVKVEAETEPVEIEEETEEAALEKETAPDPKPEAKPEKEKAPAAKQKKDEPEKAKEKKISYPSSYTKEDFKKLDFSSKRLIVRTKDQTIFPDMEVVIASNEDVYLLQFKDEKTAIEAYGYFFERADAVEVDTDISVAEGTGAQAEETVMTAEENPITQMLEAVPEVQEETFDIALIDTGAEGAEKKVSVIEEDENDENGHGTAMLNAIRSQNEKARILSIKALDKTGAGSISAVYAAIETAMKAKVKVINLSVSTFASPDSKIVEDMINEAVESGIEVVGAAGNNSRDASLYVPGKVERAWIIGAADETGTKLPLSNFGPTVDYNVVAASTSEAAALFSGLLSRYGKDGIKELVNNGLLYAPYEAQESKKIEVNVLWGKGAVTKVKDRTYLVRPAAGYRLWRIRGMDEYLDMYDFEVNEDRSFTFPEEVTQIRAYFLSDAEYAEILKSAGCEEYLKYYWDDPQWFFKYGTKVLDFEEFMEVYREYYDAQERKKADYEAGKFLPQYNPKEAAGQQTIKEVLDEAPRVGQTFTSWATGIEYYNNRDASYENQSWDFRFNITKGYGAGQVICLNCAQNGGWFPRGAGRLTFKVTKVNTSNNTFTGEVYWVPMENPIQQPQENSFKGSWEPDTGSLMLKKEGSGTTTNDLAGTIFRVEKGDDLVGYFIVRADGTGFPAVRYSASDLRSSTTKVTNGNRIWATDLTFKKGATYRYTRNGEWTSGTTTEAAQFEYTYGARTADGERWYVAMSQYKRMDLTPGTYKITETLEPINGKYDTAPAQTVRVRDDQTVTVTFTDPQKTGYLKLVKSVDTPTAVVKLTKKSSDPDVTDGNPCYSLEAAKYGIYRTEEDAEGDINRIATMVTDAEGKAQYAGLAQGTYYIREVEASPGYLVNEEIVTVDLSDLNSRYGKSATYGVYENGTWITTIETKTDGSSDPVELPIGTYTVKEIMPSENCSLAEGTATVTITQNHTKTAPYVLDETRNRIMRNIPIPYEWETEVEEVPGMDPINLALTKRMPEGASSDVKPVGAQFTFSYYKTTAYTDPDALEAAVASPERQWVLQSDEDGEIYFNDPSYFVSGDEIYLSANNLPSFPIGSVIIRETKAPENFYLNEDDYFLLLITQNEDGEASVKVYDQNGAFKQEYTASGTIPIEMDATSIVDIQTPTIRTQFADVVDGAHDALAKGEVTLTDTVAYDLVVPGWQYNIVGTLHYRDDFIDANGTAHHAGDPLLDANGEVITQQTGLFTAEATSGSKELTFTIDASLLKGQAIVAYETLYNENHDPVIHADLTDEDQTVYFPDIRTTLTDTESGNHISEAKETVSLTDHVALSNLVEGTSYRVEGVLMDQSDPEGKTPIKDDKGKPVTAVSNVFRAQQSSMETTVTFTFPGTSVKEKSTVAFEKLFTVRTDPETGKEIKKEVANHEDITDEDQTVLFPKVETTLTEEETGLHAGQEKDEITLVDVVVCSNLLPGKTYSVRGRLWDKKNDRPFLDADGNEVWSKSEAFTAREKNATVELPFTFKGTGLTGTQIVAFEYLYHDDYEVGVHADITDEDQWYFIPDIKTTLTDKQTEEHISEAGAEMTMIDTIHFESLIPGKTYRIESVLMERVESEDGAVAVPLSDDSGTAITKTGYFTPETESGETDVVFTFSGVQMLNKTVVAYETFYLDDVKVASHTEIEDEAQTVYIPKIRTELTDKQTGEHTTLAKQKITLVDTVSYENLIPGKTYTMQAVLMDKKTGQAMLDDEGKEITASREFTPSEKSGTVEVTFTFSGVNLTGKSVVAYERCTFEGTEVAAHTDINDAGQTVDIPDVGTTLTYDGTHKAPANATVTVSDEVRYTNVEKGKNYLVKGVLMNRETKKPVTYKGEIVTGESRFTASGKNGTTYVTFKFDTSEYTGLATVAYEELYQVTEDGTQTLVAQHKDLNYAGQTITVEGAPKHPKTGDHSMLLLWIVIFGAALSGCVTFATIYVKRKRSMK